MCDILKHEASHFHTSVGIVLREWKQDQYACIAKKNCTYYYRVNLEEYSVISAMVDATVNNLKCEY